MNNPGRRLAAGLYGGADLRRGDWYRTGGIRVTESHVVGFAGLAGDFFDLHMDDIYARELGFDGRVAHGLLVLALVDGLKNRADVRLAAIASLGWTWRFSAPVLIGDRIAVHIQVQESRATRRPERWLAVLDVAVTNQEGALVQAGTNSLLLHQHVAPPT